MKKVKFLNVIMIIFALFAIFGGAYAFYKTAYAFSKTGGGILVMAQQISDEEMIEYKQMLDELDEKYLVLFADVFEQAKEQLLSRTEDTLGEEYKTLKDGIEEQKKQLKELAENLNNNQRLTVLKDKLTSLKEQLIKAPNEDEKNNIKSSMKEVLSEITAINLDNFSTLSIKRKEINALNERLKAVVDEKKDLIKDVEEQVLSGAREKLKKLVFSYETEAETLAKAFGVTEYNKQPYFLKLLNPQARLIDFDRQTMLDEARNRGKFKHGHDHRHDEGHKHGCEYSGSGDKSHCESCHGCDDEDNNPPIYDSKKHDDNNN